MRTAPDALPCLIDKKNLDLFEKYHVASPDEMHARYVSKA